MKQQGFAYILLHIPFLLGPQAATNAAFQRLRSWKLKDLDGLGSTHSEGLAVLNLMNMH